MVHQFHFSFLTGMNVRSGEKKETTDQSRLLREQSGYFLERLVRSENDQCIAGLTEAGYLSGRLFHGSFGVFFLSLPQGCYSLMMYSH